MIKPEALLRPTPAGLYCPPGDFYIDPNRPVDRAVVTHGHSDHARSGHGAVLATPQTLAIMAERYGVDFAWVTEAAPYGQTVHRDEVAVTLVPAGHVLGSAQAVVQWKGLTMVVSGDYKRRRDPTCPPFEPVPCDVFITEATFGLPVFRHPDAADEVARLLKSLDQFPERTHLVGAYALGKAQRMIAELRRAGWHEPIYLHGALEKMCRLYEELGVPLGELRLVSASSREEMRGSIVLCPPSALTDTWSRRMPSPITAMASGWMRVRGRARQRNVELPLIVSDHADWDELTATIRELAPRETWITHGSEDGLLRWCELHQVKARALDLIGRGDEDDG